MVPTDPALVNLIGSMKALGKGAGLKNTEQALSAITGAIARSWQKSVGSEHRIERKKLSPFTQSVFSRDKMVHWLEKGLASYDMKMTHPKGKKSRLVKPRRKKNGEQLLSWTQKRKDGSTYTVNAGDPYLIVPFRHKTKGKKEGEATLEDIYPNLQNRLRTGDFKRSSVTTAPAQSGKVSPNYWRQMINRAEYSWGDRLVLPDTDANKKLQGMVVMGPPKQSQFMTFRVVSVNSPAGSWIHPGIKAKHYLEKILTNGQEKITSVIEDALGRDISV
jgi:hypothetical protein